jgi:hypothetical protein
METWPGSEATQGRVQFPCAHCKWRLRRARHAALARMPCIVGRCPPRCGDCAHCSSDNYQVVTACTHACCSHEVGMCDWATTPTHTPPCSMFAACCVCGGARVLLWPSLHKQRWDGRRRGGLDRKRRVQLLTLGGETPAGHHRSSMQQRPPEVTPAPWPLRQHVCAPFRRRGPSRMTCSGCLCRSSDSSLSQVF